MTRETGWYQSVVVFGIGLGLLVARALDGLVCALVLEALGSHQALDLGGLEDGLLVALDDLAANHELAHVILLGQVEELLVLGGALGTQAAGLDGVGQAGDLALTLGDDDEVAHGEVGADNATAHGAALAGTGAALAEARGALAEQEAHAVSAQHTLLHGETLLVVTAGDTEHVALMEKMSVVFRV